MKQTSGKWQRVPVPISATGGNSWERQINTIWKARVGKKGFLVQQRKFLSKNFSEMRHHIIKKFDNEKLRREGFMAMKNSEEPTYSEKLWVLTSIGKWRKIALEVYPTESNVIDGANLYHMWEMENEESLPFSIEECFTEPESFEETVNVDGKIKYTSRTGFMGKERIKYLYLRSTDGKELTWKQKQIAKNEIYSDAVIAIEVISSKGAEKNYSCLVCLPLDFRLGFGLHWKD